MSRPKKILIGAVVAVAAVPFTLGGIDGARSLATQQAAAGHNGDGGHASTSTRPSARPVARKAPRTVRACRSAIIRFRHPGSPWYATDLGCGYSSTRAGIRELKAQWDTGPGNCTQIAWSTNNPGYRTAAAKPLRKVFEHVGPDC